MEEKIFSVTRLNQYLKNLIEGDFLLSRVLIKGEVSSLVKHYSGHYYFSLKDEESKISCMMFSFYTKNLKFDVKNGDLVLVGGNVSCYEKNGTYQLYVKFMEPYGKGNELLKLEELKKKLKQEGLFDKPKKKIPPYPSRIGLITSSNGAAVHDLIHSIQKHYNPDIFLFPTLVQSENAPLSIIESLKKALNYHLDVIIISRGGGSNEDLSCFNDENLIRFASNIDVPLVSAVGHSIDATLLDLIADLTCITPTEAGEKVVPDKTNLIKEIIHKQERLTYLINNQISCYQQRLLLLNASKGLVPPDIKINNQMLKLSNLNARLDYLFTNKFVELNKELHLLEEKLKSLNPLKILSKGYSIVYLNDQIITSSHLLEVNQEISITLNQGKIKAIISAKEE